MRERFLVDDRAARSVDQVSRGLHQREPLRIDDVAGLRRQRTAHRQHVRAAEQILQPDKFNAEFSSDGPVGEWVMGDEFHVERLRHAEDLSADITDAERPQRTPNKSNTHMLRALVESVRSLASQRVLGEQFAGQRQHEGDDTHSNRPSHAVGRDDQSDPGIRAGLDVDGVVADAEAGNDSETTASRNARRLEAMCKQDQRVEILKLFGTQRVVRFQERYFDVGSIAQRPEIEVRIGRRAVRFSEVTGERHPELALAIFRCPYFAPGADFRRPRRPSRHEAPRRHPNSR